MKAKSLMIVALAAFCCLGTQARSKKKSTVKPVVAAAADVKPVPADSFSSPWVWRRDSRSSSISFSAKA